ncbi:MAG: SpoIIE family protein phosphatase [Anaerolineae bacterium]|nr:SpoIIE family protein phosphatase [Anaerolineae bacterium]
MLNRDGVENLTTNTITLQKLPVLDNFIHHWQTVVGSNLLLLSNEGEILASANGTPPLDWQAILKKSSSRQATILNHSDHQILTSPLTIDQETLGYLLAFETGEEHLPLLTWGAEIIGEQLLGEKALSDMTDELIGAWDQLELIYRVTKNLDLTSDLMEALQSIIQEIKKVVDTESGFILLKRSNRLECVSATPHPVDRFCDQTLLEKLVNARQAILCKNPAECRRIWAGAAPDIDSMLAIRVPIIGEETEAAIGLTNKQHKIFSAGDVKLIAALAQQVGTIIKNYFVRERLIIESRLSRELEIAAEIQESLLPTHLPHVGGVSIAVSSSPASEVGGDFYDFITRDDHHLTLVMGDVAGKGIPAAMLTSVTRTMLRVEAMRGESPHNIISQANNVLHQDLARADSFVTAFVATIDTAGGTLEYASAGHTPALLWRAESRTTEQLRATFPPIGIFGYQGHSTQTITLKPGDTLILYTDGITEAESPNGDLFGLNRLIYILESRAGEAPEDLQHFIQSEVASFRRDAPGRDDASLLIVKMLPQTGKAEPKDISTPIKTVDFSYPADIKYLSEIAEKVTKVCRDLPALRSGFEADDFIYLIELAISEICTNIIKHAYADCEGYLDGRVTLLNNGIQLDFYDNGEGFDPNTVPPPNMDPEELVEGGYGLHIVRQIMDVVSYENHPKRGNHWYLLKLLPH